MEDAIAHVARLLDALQAKEELLAMLPAREGSE